MALGDTVLQQIKIPSPPSLLEVSKKVMRMSLLLTFKFVEDELTPEEKIWWGEEIRDTLCDVGNFVQECTGRTPTLVTFPFENPWDSPDIPEEKMLNEAFNTPWWYFSIGNLGSEKLRAITFHQIENTPPSADVVWLPDSAQLLFEAGLSGSSEDGDIKVRAFPRLIIKGFCPEDQKWEAVVVEIYYTFHTNLVPWRRLKNFIRFHNEYLRIKRLKEQGCPKEMIQNILRICQQKAEPLSTEERFSSLVTQLLFQARGGARSRVSREKIKALSLPLTEESVLFVAEALGCTETQQKVLRSRWVEQKGDTNIVNPGDPWPTCRWKELAEVRAEQAYGEWRFEEGVCIRQELEAEWIMFQLLGGGTIEEAEKAVMTKTLDKVSLEHVIGEIAKVSKILCGKGKEWDEFFKTGKALGKFLLYLLKEEQKKRVKDGEK